MQVLIVCKNMEYLIMNASKVKLLFQGSHLDAQALFLGTLSVGPAKGWLNKDLLLDRLMRGRVGTSHTLHVDRCETVRLMAIHTDAKTSICDGSLPQRKSLDVSSLELYRGCVNEEDSSKYYDGFTYPI